MRIVFMGTPDFAVPSLQILLENGHDIAAVVTAPDKPGGRLGLQASAVKQFAQQKGLPILQPEKLRNPDFLQALRDLHADLQVVVAFRMLPEVVWNMPPCGTLNLHGSLLPKYRGAAPINWAIIRGEKTTGVTTFLLQHEIDTGDILLQQPISISPNETAGELHDRMMIAGAHLVLETVRRLEQNDLFPQPQPDEEATHAPKLFRETCEINFHQTSQNLHNFIRGLSPYPGAWTTLHGKTFKILRSSLPTDTVAKSDKPMGSYATDGKTFLKVKTLDGFLQLEEVQLEGKKRMSVRELLNGYSLFDTD
jgi:methionyl-tRNA formyltransferase